MTGLNQNNANRRSTRVGSEIGIGLEINDAASPKRIPFMAKKFASTLILMAMSISVVAQKPNADLTSTSLEDLMNIEVTSVSKKEEKLFQSAAAVYVITQEEIVRSGLNNIPELLRLVPGLDVARIDGTKWAVSSRGFNGRFTNKLLVLVDGRSVYTPETSGVYWEAQDVLMEDVERIEVIRGPGGTMWGANAVNGVINIITKHSKDTHGGLVTTGGGSEERGFGSVRYGGGISEHADYKVYGKYFNRSGLVNAAGIAANDGQQAGLGGGRVDWESKRDSLSVQGELFQTNFRENGTNISPAAPFAPHTNTQGVFSGGHILGRWSRTLSEGSDTELQVYYDQFNRDVFDLQQKIGTFDVDFHHQLNLGQRQEFIWGLGYRRISDETNSTSASPVSLNPKDKTVQLFNVFAQDEFTLIRDRMRLTLGTKLEHDELSGFQLQPTARLMWTPSKYQTLWGAISRAARTPSRGDRGLRVNAAAFPVAGGTTAIVALLGNENTTAEDLRAFEIGYRVQPARRFSLDVATFYNVYNRLATLEPGFPFFEVDPLPPHLVIPLRLANLMRGETYGLETSANWNVNHYWRLSGGYSFLRMHLHRFAESLDEVAEGAEGHDPRHQFQLHSFLALPKNLKLDTSLYQVSSRPTIGISRHTRLDARLGWRARENVELSLALQDLLDKQHPEFTGVGILASQPGRAAYGKLTWRF